MFSETYTLSNWIVIPKIWFGTWLITRENAVMAVKQALDVGYRHIDTAQAYRNEIEVWKAIRESWLPRNEIFLTTKLAAETKDWDSARQMIEESFEKLGCDYIDLMIIHSPQPWSLVNKSEDRFFEWNISARNVLQEYYKSGKIKAIWVSNFLQQDLENLMYNCEIKPMVNQILCHISNTPIELIDFCQQNDILVEAYSPMWHGEILNNPDIEKIAERYGVSIAQLCIRYTIQLWLVSLPKALKREHMINNMDINFEISESDMNILKNFDKIENYWKSSFFPVLGGKL